MRRVVSEGLFVLARLDLSSSRRPLELSEKSNPRLFRLARVGLGALGIVTEVLFECAVWMLMG